LLFILLLCPFSGWIFSQFPGRYRIVVGIVGFIVVSIIAGATAFRGLKKIKLSWQYRLGAKGEQVVGRELDRLIAQDYRVFHDMPFVGWNIDHLVVGPRGVFAVETKAWRKPRQFEAVIVLDGDTLILPGNRQHRAAIAQADRNAKSLTKWIANFAAEQVVVVPVVALPGWSLDIRRYGEVAVYSATNMSEHLPKRGKMTLTPEQIQRIAAQIEKQCTLPAAPDVPE
jgi:hypothetical protein